ncbi:MAG: IS66 family transposase [Alphaproteobacteria bacterium]|nr:IS66 family transposase [Alphaproteobacteria bacterium]
MASAKQITISKEEFEALKAENAWLKHQLAELKRLIYGAKSERFVTQNPEQTTLFDFPAEQPAEQPTEEITYTRNKPAREKKQPLRLELPSHLERRVEVIEPENLPADAKMIGEAVTEILEYEPANAYVRRIVRRKYIVEQTDEETRIAIAPLPTLPIPKGNAGASMIAHILVSKFVDHIPFYRQNHIFKRQDLIIPESTLGGWFSAGGKLLVPIHQTIKTKILAGWYLMADETPIAVLSQDKPGATHKGYYWVYYDPVNKLVLFDYRKTRGMEGPDEMLNEFAGYVQTDGYNAYNHFEKRPKITLLACMAHSRRKFEHAQENNPILAGQALSMFRELYDIEREARDENLSTDGIKELRQKKSKPILVRLETWMREQIILVPPKSAIGIAMAYTLNLWPRLIRYTDDGRFHIDNNLIENSIRPVALGRKNYLFAGSHEAAQHAAVIYSILATCKLHQVEPFAYLSKILSIIPDCPANQLHTLLPGQK